MLYQAAASTLLRHLDVATRLLRPANRPLLAARLADLVGADPLAFDAPGAKALVVRVVTSKVAVLDQAATRVLAFEVDDLELIAASAKIRVRAASM